MRALFVAAVVFTLLACILVLTGPAGFNGRHFLALAGCVVLILMAPAIDRTA